MAKLIDGKKISKKILDELTVQFKELREHALYPPKLVSVMVGKEKDAEIYVRVQERTARKIGIDFEIMQIDKGVSEEDVLAIIKKLNDDKEATAIIVQHPLPEGLDHNKIVSSILPVKDAEGVHTYNLGKIFRREADIVPCTPGAVMKILRVIGVDLYGKDVVLIGHSPIVGKPLSLMLLNESATTSVCHIGTSEKGDIAGYSRDADILIVAVGKAALVKNDWVKEGAIVIDVGINNVSGEIVGDVDFVDVEKKASAITPVPGGVGPVTVSILMRNVLRSYRMQNGEVQ